MFTNRKTHLLMVSMEDNIWAMFSSNMQAVGQLFSKALDLVDRRSIFGNLFLEVLNYD